jgi:hypothetical protein
LKYMGKTGVGAIVLCSGFSGLWGDVGKCSKIEFLEL